MSKSESAERKTVLRFGDLKAKGLFNNRVTCFRWVKAGLFPAPISLGPNTIGWLSEEVEHWLEERAAQRQGAA